MQRVWGVTAPPPEVRRALTVPGSRIPALLLFPLHIQGRAPVSSKGPAEASFWVVSSSARVTPALSGWVRSVLVQSSSQRSSSGHGCNSRGPGWLVWGIKWWSRFGKRTSWETEYRTRYCNGRSSPMFGLCRVWEMTSDGYSCHEWETVLLSFRFIQPSSENRQNRTDYKLDNLHNLQFLLGGGLERESGRIKEKKWKWVRGKLGVKK